MNFSNQKVYNNKSVESTYITPHLWIEDEIFKNLAEKLCA